MCGEHPQSRMHVDRLLVDLYQGVAESMDVGDGRDLVDEILDPEDPADPPEVEATLEVGAVHRDRTDGMHIIVAVHVAEVSKIHGVLPRLLGMALEAEVPERRLAPLGGRGRGRGKVPGRRPAAAAEPGEDEAEDLPGGVDAQSGGLGGRGVGGGDALAGGIELEAVEGTDESAVAHLAAHVRTEARAQVRAHGVGHADAAFVVAPGDDLPAEEGLLDQSLPEKGLAGREEIPPLRERRQSMIATTKT